MSGSGGSAKWPPWRTAAEKTVVTVEKIHDGICSTTRFWRRAPCPAFMSRASRGRRARLAGRLACRIITAPTPNIWRCTRRWRRRRRLCRLPGQYVYERRARDFRDEELLADVIARLIGDVRPRRGRQRLAHSGDRRALGARSAAMGAPTCRCCKAASTISSPTARANCSIAQAQGRIDVFFLSGGQIDGAGNVNLVSTGDYAHPMVRFPGSFGSAYLYYVGAESDPVPHRAFAPHAGAKSGFHQRAGLKRGQCLPQRWADRAGHQRCCSPSRKAASRWRACIPATPSSEVVENTGFDFVRPAYGAGHAGALARHAHADA